jgi:hypothetical protein
MSKFTVRFNGNQHSVEVAFDGKPNSDVRSALKGDGYRWSPGSMLWYKKHRNGGSEDSAIENAISLLCGASCTASENSLFDGPPPGRNGNDKNYTSDKINGNDIVQHVVALIGARKWFSVTPTGDSFLVRTK